MPHWLIDIPAQFWTVLREMAPYLLFGFLAAGILSLLISPEWVQRHLGHRGIKSVFKAALFGVPLPLCSCGVIPVAVSMRRHGASRGATVAFLISTPMTGVDSIVVTYSLMGSVFAIFRPVAALVAGVLGGTLTEWLHKPAPADASGRAEPPAEACTDPCCAPTPRGGKLRAMLEYAFITLPRDLGWSLVGGLLVAAAITALVPPGVLQPYLGGGVGSMLLMMLLGIPVYVCATASVPVGAALIYAGASPGAVLVWLMTGPASNAATIATVWKVLGAKTALIYLFSIAATSLAAGLAMDWFFQVEMPHAHDGHPHEMLPMWLQDASAVALLAIMAWAILSPLRGRPHKHGAPAEPGPAEVGMQTLELAVTGMTCGHCAATVRSALAGAAGVQAVEVDQPAGKATVRGRDLDRAALAKAVESAGFHVEA